MEDARVETANVGGKFSSLGIEWGKIKLQPITIYSVVLDNICGRGC